MILRTERLLLRRARMDDVGAFHAIMSDPRAMRYWSTPPHATLDETREWVASMVERSSLEPCSDFVVELDGRAIGKAGCYKLPEIGYILHPDAWGRGYAREAMAAVIAHIFATNDIERLIADVDPRNEPSHRPDPAPRLHRDPPRQRHLAGRRRIVRQRLLRAAAARSGIAAPGVTRLAGRLLSRSGKPTDPPPRRSPRACGPVP